MTITLHLPEELEKGLVQRALEKGQDVEVYIQHLIKKDIEGRVPVDEILAPFRRQVEESGMTDEQLRNFFEEVRDEVWHEKQGARGYSVGERSSSGL